MKRAIGLFAGFILFILAISYLGESFDNGIRWMFTVGIVSLATSIGIIFFSLGYTKGRDDAEVEVEQDKIENEVSKP
jgi:hypothetical protein